MNYIVKWFCINGNSNTIEEACDKARLIQLLTDETVLVFRVEIDYTER